MQQRQDLSKQQKKIIKIRSQNDTRAMFFSHPGRFGFPYHVTEDQKYGEILAMENFIKTLDKNNFNSLEYFYRIKYMFQFILETIKNSGEPDNVQSDNSFSR